MTFRIFVRNLSFYTTPASIKAYFQQFGRVKDVYIRLDRYRRSKGFGFVLFESDQVGEEVLQLVEHLIDDRIVTCHPVIRKQDETTLTAEQEVLSYLGLFP